MPAHIDRHHVIVRREIRRDVIELMRHPADAVQHDETAAYFRAPVQIVEPQAVHFCKPVHVPGLRAELPTKQPASQDRDGGATPHLRLCPE